MKKENLIDIVSNLKECEIALRVSANCFVSTTYMLNGRKVKI